MYPRFNYEANSKESILLEKLDEQRISKEVKESEFPIYSGGYERQNLVVKDVHNTSGTSFASLKTNERIEPIQTIQQTNNFISTLQTEEDRIKITQYNRNIRNNAIILPNGNLLSTVDNKSIVSDVHSHVADLNKSLTHATITPKEDPRIQLITPQAPPANDENEDEKVQQPRGGLYGDSSKPKLDLEQVHLKHVDIQPNNDFAPIKFNESKDDLDFPLLGKPENYILSVLPPQLSNLFRNGGIIAKKELVNKLKNGVANIRKRQPGDMKATESIGIMTQIIPIIQSFTDDSYIKFPGQIGKGIFPKVQRIPKIVKKRPGSKRNDIPFGDLLIDQNQLFDNVVNPIRNTTKQPLSQFPKRHVSRKLANLIYQISQGKTYGIPFDTLDSMEQDYLAKLLKASRIEKDKSFSERQIYLPPNFTAMQNELKRLIGEIHAGNDSTFIKSKLVNLVSYLQNNTSFDPNIAKTIIKKYGM